MTTATIKVNADRVKYFLVAVLVVWQFGLNSLLTIAGLTDWKLGVLAKMLWGLNLLWVAGIGALSIRFRERVSAVGRTMKGNRVVSFFGFVVILALIEEAITTAMTNCAPLFGAQIGEVYLTASANYFDVVLFHSVVVMLPQFAAWGILLQRYELSPFAAFLCYGFTGFINEALFSGPNPLQLAQWILVYGLLVYLPAYLFVGTSGRRHVDWWFYPVLVFVPVIASLPVVALLLLVIAPGHPSIHFPPM
ncbi:hypothetical protein [Allorhodopirellula solitaria]|uniref:Uncharacterized protein n=1 Tax=Allorhodopirellula solitaria TaxID=2527987 RepID=A0A5C5XP48_9BACT|nr:hypothetical protein [Allorhodopirellula solitaria]TWT64987.1 hypothetical protein CA85_33320 [Allorhodopirellula solitaria]